MVFQEFSDNTVRNDLCNLIKHITKCFPAPMFKSFRDPRSHFHVSSKRLTSRGKVLEGLKRLRLSAGGLLWSQPWLLGQLLSVTKILPPVLENCMFSNEMYADLSALTS